MQEIVKEEQCAVASTPEGHETKCWGCGLRLLLASYAPIYKCGWCGAITNRNPWKRERRCSRRWIRLRDRFFVIVVLLFMLFVICGGVWAVYPVVFAVSYFCGVFHCTVTFILSVSTLSSFSLAAFLSPGAPPSMIWGSYPVVGKGGLENYTYCIYCSRPKSPRTHHCRSCGMCVLDMDHHCPFLQRILLHIHGTNVTGLVVIFWAVAWVCYSSQGIQVLQSIRNLLFKIGNCVGAGNHRYFIIFLFSAVVSTTYVFVISAYAGLHLWPPLAYRSLEPSIIFREKAILTLLKEVIHSLLSSALLLSTRGLVVVYLAIASLSVQIGLTVLLWQQLCYIYKGKTYLDDLSSSDSGSDERGCQNLCRFFGCPYSALRFLLGSSDAGKIHKK